MNDIAHSVADALLGKSCRVNFTLQDTHYFDRIRRDKRMTWHQTVAVGNLGGDPDLKFMQSGDAVCNFSVAVSEKWNDKRSGEQKESTTWYRVAVWGAQAEACNKYLRKGSKVLVTGTVSARAYTGNGGDAAASLDLRAFNVRFLDSAGARPAAGDFPVPNSSADTGDFPGEIPF